MKKHWFTLSNSMLFRNSEIEQRGPASENNLIEQLNKFSIENDILFLMLGNNRYLKNLINTEELNENNYISPYHIKNGWFSYYKLKNNKTCETSANVDTDFLIKELKKQNNLKNENICYISKKNDKYEYKKL